MTEFPLPVIITDWRPLPKNTLLGFCSMRLPSGIQIADCSVHQKNGKFWVSPPGKPQLDRDGIALRDAVTGRIKYLPIITFETKAFADRFSAQIIEALRRAFPEALV
jgi:hypothetical protein